MLRILKRFRHNYLSRKSKYLVDSVIHNPRLLDRFLIEEGLYYKVSEFPLKGYLLRELASRFIDIIENRIRIGEEFSHRSNRGIELGIADILGYNSNSELGREVISPKVIEVWLEGGLLKGFNSKSIINIGISGPARGIMLEYVSKVEVLDNTITEYHVEYLLQLHLNSNPTIEEFSTISEFVLKQFPKMYLKYLEKLEDYE